MNNFFENYLFKIKIYILVFQHFNFHFGKLLEN